MSRPRTFLSLAVATLALVVGSPTLASAAPPPATGWQFTIDPTPVHPAAQPLGPATATTCGPLEGEWKSADGTAWQMPAVGTSSSWGDLTLNYWKLTRDAERAVTLEHYAALPPDGVPKVTHRGSAPIVPTPAGTCRQECPVGGGEAPSPAPANCAKPRVDGKQKKIAAKGAEQWYRDFSRYYAAFQTECRSGIAHENFWRRIKLCSQMQDSLGIMSRNVVMLQKIANDPPDPEFRSIAKPVGVKAKGVRASGRLSRRGARTINRMLNAQARTAALRAAVATAIERANGAVVHGAPEDVGFERRQMLAAAGYAEQLAGVLDGLGSRSFAAVNAMKRAGVRSRVDRKAAGRVQRTIAQRGLASGVVARMRRAGWSQEKIESLQRELAAAKPAQLAVSLPGAWVDRGLLDSYVSEAKSMRGFAARVRADPTAAAS